MFFEKDMPNDIKTRLNRLKTEHRALDAEISEALKDPFADQIHIQRLKKRKLALKDEISSLENNAIPDIIA